MKVLQFLLLGLSLFFLSCEDTKKRQQTIPDDTSEKSKETPIQKKDTLTAAKKTTTYPKITSNNVVEFLTEYGEANPETKVRINTRLGQIDIALYEDTPLHRANFIYLIKQDYFDDTFFHRIVPDFIIQGGNSDNASTNKKRYAIGEDYLIPAEINNRNHTYGSVSGAKEYRANPDKQSMPFEFFIFLGPQSSTSHLNGNYTVFGKVTSGMDVVENIANLPADEGEWPQQNVVIEAEVLE